MSGTPSMPETDSGSADTRIYVQRYHLAGIFSTLLALSSGSVHSLHLPMFPFSFHARDLDRPPEVD